MRLTKATGALALVLAARLLPGEVYDVPYGSETAQPLTVIGAGTPVDARRAKLEMSWTEDALRLRFEFETAPRGKLRDVGNAVPGGGAPRAVWEDSIELWIDPPAEVRPKGLKNKGVFQAIFSHTGARFGRHHNPGYGLAAREWQLDGIRFDSTVTGDVWKVAIDIPPSSFGMKAYCESEWPMIVARNFRIGTPARQASFLPSGSFDNAAGRPHFRFVRTKAGKTYDRYAAAGCKPYAWETPEAYILAEGREPLTAETVVRGTRLPVPGALVMEITAEGAAKEPYRRYFSSAYREGGCYIGFQDMPYNGFLFVESAKSATHEGELIRNYVKRPPSGRKAVVAFTFEPHKMTYYVDGGKIAEVGVKTDLSAAGLGDLTLLGGEKGLTVHSWTLFSRTLTDHEVKDLSMGESCGRGKVGWYPSIASLAVDLSVQASALGDGGVQLTVRRRKDDTVAFSGLIDASRGVRTAGERPLVVLHETVRAGDLPEGDYTVEASLPSSGNSVVARQDFVVRHYPWESTALGREDRLHPFFSPLAVSGHTLKCTLRDYDLGVDGLPGQIVADGKAILARSVRVMGEKDGKPFLLTGGERAFAPRRLSDTTVEYESVGSVKTVRGRLEQDGLLKFDLVFPQPPDADRVWMEIPVKADCATLFHACGDGIRSNPGGFLPKGPGLVFKSRDLPQDRVSNFIPYCWVGTDTRGVAYAADWDRGWIHCRERDAVEIVRESDGTAVIRLNILNARVRKAGARTVTLALMASPVKRLEPGWRGWSGDYIVGRGPVRNCVYLPSPPFFGSFQSWLARYPAWQNMDVVRLLRRSADTGKIEREALKILTDRTIAAGAAGDAEVPWLVRMDEKQRRTSVGEMGAGNWFASLLHGRPNAILSYYSCDTDDARALDEYPAFVAEWEWCGVAQASYADYAIYWFDRMIEAGMQGIFDDNSFVSCSFCWPTGNGWVDENGEVHPSFGIWRSRDYHRRQANVLLARGMFPWVSNHITNANILPTLSFSVYTVGMEWHYGKSDFQTRFRPDYIRAVLQGLQCGCLAAGTDGVAGIGDPAERRRVTRTMLASLLVHGMQPQLCRGSVGELLTSTCQKLFDWGIGERDCVATYYWDGANPVVSSEKDVYVTTFRRDTRLLCVVSSWTDKPRNVRMSASGLLSAQDWEIEKPLMVRDGGLDLDIAPHDFRLIELVVR